MGNKRKKIRVVLLTDCLANLMGGAERQIYELAKGLDKNKFDVTIASLECVGQTPRHLIEEIGCHFIDFRVKRIYGLSGLIQGVRFWHFLRNKQIDILQTYHFSSDIWGAWIAHLAGVKLIISNRRDMGFWRSRRHVVTYKWVNRYVHKIIVNAQAIKTLFVQEENIPEVKVQVIYNGIDLAFDFQEKQAVKIRQKIGLSKEDLVMMHVANLTPVKGHRYLIGAISQIISSHAYFKLVLIGEGPLRAELEAQINRLELEKHVILLGKQKNARQLLTAADMCILSSISEGMSNAILEYMAAGRPVIATNIGGNPELVVHGVTGILVDKENCGQIKEAIKDLMNDPQKRSQMGKEGLKRIEREFTMLSMVTAYTKIFEQTYKKEQPICVCHLVSSNGMFGAERVILNLAQSKDLNSHVGVIHNLHNSHLEVIAEAKKLGLNTVVFDSNGRFDLKTILRIRKFLRENNVDILHTHNYKADVLGFFATRLVKTKWVATNHVWHGLDRKLRLYEKIDAFLLRFAKHITAVSAEIKEVLVSKRILAKKISVVDNGIDIQQFNRPFPEKEIRRELGLDNNDFVVSIVGRLSPEKGHRTFLKAAKEVTQKKSNVKFLIIGDGPSMDDLKTEAKQLQLNGRVIFTGVRDDVPSMYAISNIMVNSSSIEGLPMTILEAMAAKIALIVTPVGAVPKVIKHEVNGLIVDSGDDKGLSEGICSLIDDPSKRKNLIECAYREVCDRFSSEVMAARYGQIYESIV